MTAMSPANIAPGLPKRFRVRVHIVGDELTIPLPQEVRDERGLRDGDELDMRIELGQIVLTAVPKR